MTAASAPARLVTLDAMRGFAVMGILAMNIIGFSMPEWAAASPGVFGGETLADKFSWLFSFIFIDGKMRGLFSLLFGASMMLVIESAEAKQQSAARVHYARMFWLAIFGLFHYFFLWFGDILFTYAIIGCLAFRMHHWEPKRLITWALIVYGLGFLLWAVQFGGLHFFQWAATQPSADAELVKQYREMMAGDGFNPSIAKELAQHRGNWMDIVSAKLASPWDPLIAVIQALTETLPLMMLGMACKKNGFVTGEWAESDYRLWINRLLLPGLSLLTLIGGIAWVSGFDLIFMIGTVIAWSAIPRLMLTIAYAAILILLIRRYQGHHLIGRIAAAGRAAFTNYLGTSIVMTTIFYGYGLGLFGYVSRPQLWFFVIGAWLLMLLWSQPWLQRFHYGPLEWLWRSLSRLQLQPIRKAVD
jgi:uncharacterized protein